MIADALADLLTDVPHVMFCIKGLDGRYVSVNQAFADRAGAHTPAEVVGRSATELFPAELALNYERQDAMVLRTGQSLRSELEMITRPDGSIGWYVTSKTRLGTAEKPLGIASVSVDLRVPADASGPHGGLALAISFARAHATESKTVSDVAAAAGLTTTQLERSLRRALGISTKQLMLRFRLEMALACLRSTDSSMAQIANECGYYDQSAFTRQFRRVVGMSPGAYRSSIASR